MAVQVVCKYESVSCDFKRCTVKNVDLTSTNKEKTFIFSGSNDEKSEVREVHYDGCGNIDFIPLDIFREFPNLNRISIKNSNLPVINAKLFTKDFKNIQYLFFSDNNIQLIEENAFAELIELKGLNVYHHKIEYLKEEIFKKNFNLEYVYLSNNSNLPRKTSSYPEIKMINPKIFENLRHLKTVKINDTVFQNTDRTLPALHNFLTPQYCEYMKYKKLQATYSGGSQEFVWKQKYEAVIAVSLIMAIFFYFLFMNHFYLQENQIVNEKYKSCIRDVKKSENELENFREKFLSFEKELKLLKEKLIFIEWKI
jgi:hypothetical protein